ncbi:hypothetical protein CK203_064782 [Vitis vinifera]|uniref:Uncharacterized protein n=1 Tax=Vitis vinifera TaxID=29760 RepID=A0A438FQ04_VITVI|nr:hypothetical protein CK203_064782 [Vitis vinifera]
METANFSALEPSETPCSTKRARTLGPRETSSQVPANSQALEDIQRPSGTAPEVIIKRLMVTAPPILTRGSRAVQTVDLHISEKHGSHSITRDFWRYMPTTLLCHVLEHMGYPTEPHLECRHHCREHFTLDQWTQLAERNSTEVTPPRPVPPMPVPPVPA